MVAVEPEAYDDESGEPQRPMGFVVDEDRGSLPYRLIHGEALVAAAAWAMGEAGVDLVDVTVPWHVIADLGRALVLHDPLCPMTPPDFIAECARTAIARDAVVVGVRPVTDTVKQVEDGRLGATVDRERTDDGVLAGRAARAGGRRTPGSADERLHRAGGRPAVVVRVVTVDAPPTARRVSSDEDIQVLESLTDPL